MEFQARIKSEDSEKFAKMVEELQIGSYAITCESSDNKEFLIVTLMPDEVNAELFKYLFADGHFAEIGDFTMIL